MFATGASWEKRAAPPQSSPEESWDGGFRKGPPGEQSLCRMLHGYKPGRPVLSLSKGWPDRGKSGRVGSCTPPRGALGKRRTLRLRGVFGAPRTLLARGIESSLIHPGRSRPRDRTCAPLSPHKSWMFPTLASRVPKRGSFPLHAGESGADCQSGVESGDCRIAETVATGCLGGLRRRRGAFAFRAGCPVTGTRAA